MRVIVVSDTHFRNDKFIESVKTIDNIDQIIHLGDMVQDAKEIRDTLKIPMTMIRGNNDYSDNNTPWRQVVRLLNHKALLTHGHLERVNFGVLNLIYSAKESECEMVMYGHTHIYHYEEIDGIKILNPGSAGHDRGGEYESYAILDITEDEIKVERIRL